MITRIDLSAKARVIMDDLPTGKRKFYAAVADKYSAIRSLTVPSS